MQSALMSNNDKKGDYEKCEALVIKLLRKDANKWCDFAHDRDCSLAGIYQPPLPIHSNEFGEFIATSNFYDVFAFLGLNTTAPLSVVRQRARYVCSMGLYDLEIYNSQLNKSISDLDELVQFCFRATFVAGFLIEGLGFPATYNVTAIDVLDGQKLGWALGSTLYEINTLPWSFEGSLLKKIGHGSDDSDEMLLETIWPDQADESIFRSIRENSFVGLFLGFSIVIAATLLTIRYSRRYSRRSSRSRNDLSRATSSGSKEERGSLSVEGSSYGAFGHNLKS